MIKLGAHSEFTKSSYSGGNGACVEVRSLKPASVDVQDSKHVTGTSPVLTVGPAAFTALVEFARTI
jgi:hypothetical protein